MERQSQPKAKDAERPLHAPDAAEDVVAQSTPAAPLSPGYAPPDPTNPTTLQLRRDNVAQMQRSLGNARVARKLAQRDDPPAASAAPAAPSSAAAGLIVDDAATDIQPGQMTKSAFLAQLRSAVEATAAAELAGSPLMSEARSQIDQQFAQYNALSGPALEQAVKREVPAAAGATSAQGYIAPICARVRTTIAEQRAALPPGAEAVAGVASGIASAASSVASAASSALSSIGSIFFKAREGGAQAPDDPRAVQAQLGTGHALDSRVQSGLESALGQNFGGVRVHSDTHAAGLSDQMNARAFTVGQDIAFGSGEYQPGTLFGDALIAHEVAHVAQQSGAGPAAVQQKGAGDYGALEADADQSAVGAMAAMWGGLKGGLSKIGQNALPQLKSGLRLQKCGGKATPTAVVPPVRDTLIPFDQAPLSAPGERILFNDDYTHASPGDFELVYAGAGGTFDTAGGAATKTVPGLSSGNISFYIGTAWDGTTPVNVTLTVRHRSSGTVVLTDTWTFGKKPYVPTTMDQQEGEGERALGSVYHYHIGPDRGGDGVDDYLHQTILETFGQRTCNITQAELKPDYLAAHPELTSPEAITAHFFGTSSNNGTFTVSAGDRIADVHGGNMPDKATFEAALTTMKEVTVDLPQTYEIQPGVALGRYTVRRIMKVDGSKKLMKMKQP